MAKLKAIDQAVVITSTLTNGEIEKSERYFPKALTVVEKNEDGKNEIVFAIGTGREGKVNGFSIEFPKGEKDEPASITIQIPKMSKKARKEFVKDIYGKALQGLLKVEANYKANKDAFDKEYAELDKNIDVE